MTTGNRPADGGHLIIEAEDYDEVTMPPELRKAHQENDRAVMAAYGFTPGQTTESECVAELFKIYQELTKKEI